jgi:hypothetical protein
MMAEKMMKKNENIEQEIKKVNPNFHKELGLLQSLENILKGWVHKLFCLTGASVVHPDW